MTNKRRIHTLRLILLAIACSLMISSCSETVRRVDGSHVELDELIQQLPSPNGTLWCNVYYSSGRGATYGESVTVTISKEKELKDWPTEDDEFGAYWSYRDADITVEWIDDTHIIVYNHDTEVESIIDVGKGKNPMTNW